MKKYLGLIIVFLCVFTFNVYASDIDIVSVDVDNKTQYVDQVNDPVINENEINYNLKFLDYEQNIVYKVNLKNNTSHDYNYELVLNQSNIIYELLEDDGIINANSSKDVLLKITYYDEIDESLYENNSYNIKDKLQLVLTGPEDDGIIEQVKGVIEDIKENPKTGRFFSYGLVLVFIISGTIIYLKVRKNTVFKYNVLLLLLLLPMVVYAAKTKTITIDINLDIEVNKPKVAILQQGTTINSIIKYDLQGAFVEYFKRSETDNSNSVEISLSDSDYPVHAWYNDDDKTVYYYSEAIRILYNPITFYFYGGYPNLKGIADFKTNIAEDLDLMFYNSSSNMDDVNIDVSFWNMKQAVDIYRMFEGFGENCKNVTVTANDWQLDNVNNLEHVFSNIGKASSSSSATPVTTENIIINANNWYIPNEISEDHIHEIFYSYGSYANNHEVHATNWNLPNIKTLKNAFYGTGAHPTNTLLVDFSGWNVPNVTTMEDAFHFVAEGAYGSDNGTLDAVLNVSGWNTPSLTNIEEIFMQSGEYVHSFKIIGLEDWDVSNVTNMIMAFDYVGMKAKELDISGIEQWDVSSVTNMSRMLEYNAMNAETYELDLSGWDVSNLENCYNAFNDIGLYSNYVYFNVSGWSLDSVGSNCSAVFEGIGGYAGEVVFDASNINLYGVDYDYIFGSIASNATLANIDFSGAVLRKPNVIASIAYYAETANINLSGIDYSNLTGIPYSGIGGNAKYLTIDMSDSKINNNTLVDEFFSGIGGMNVILDINFSNLDLQNTTSLNGLFKNFAKKAHQVKLDMSEWDTSGITDMSNMFYNALSERWVIVNYVNYQPNYTYYSGTEAPTLDLIGIGDWDVSNVTTMDSMFYNSFAYVLNLDIDLSNWDTSSLTDIDNMFRGCGRYFMQSIKIDVSGWDTSHVTSAADVVTAFAGGSPAAQLIGYNDWDLSNT